VAAFISIEPTEPSFGMRPKRPLAVLALLPDAPSGGPTSENLTESGSGSARPRFENGEAV
jgi:hypothetical protein